MEESTPDSRPPREPSRAQASSNWRTKSADTPEIPEGFQSRYRQGDRSRQQVNSSSSSRGFSDSRRENPRGTFSGNFNSGRSSSLSNTPNDEQTLQAIAEGRRIYVGNLVYHAKPEDVEALFTTTGGGGENAYNINRVVMSLDPFTGRNPSYCFVELATKEQANHAMEALNSVEVLGRPVKIKPCIPRHDNGTGGAPSTRNVPPSRWERSDASEHWKGMGAQGKRLFIGGLSKPVTQNDSHAKIAGLFEGFTVEAISKFISPRDSPTAVKDPNGHHYYCFVDLATSDEVDAAIDALNGIEVFGGKIKVSRAKQGDSRKVDERKNFDRERGQSIDEGAA
ncbi:RNA-binding domain-containing protein [Tothia fuscella]|uniref:RNA-binding domain-containing protein n=1 Tax=Tothia fuscella TaxID=1048955 RepID=A0A9P4P4I6_9PEZI|nr:RNA-binding domain-containing protein [Tothia fuscella]